MRALILIIDDLISEAQATQRFFEEHGHQCTIETSGREAIRILRSSALFDVTFLDLLMPDVNGEQVYQAIRLHAPARLKRLAFFTGMGYLADTWLRRTGIPVIEKGPQSPPVLLRTVEQFAKLTCTRGPRDAKDDKLEAGITGIEPPTSTPRLHRDHSEEKMPPHKTPPRLPPSPSHPELQGLYDDDMEVDTDMIAVAQKKGASSTLITELRIRYLHSSNRAMKDDLSNVRGEVSEVKGAVEKVAEDVTTTKTDLGTLKTEITTTIKTSFKWLSAIVTLLGAAGAVIAWLLEHFLLKK
jgi:CheY-like chemotaxis protein